jgi:ABC-type transport system involved in multi-copper enzyme maturation permease subunit
VSLVGAELLKLRTTRLLLWLGLLVLALLALIVSLDGANRSAFDLAQASSQRYLVTTAVISALVSLILGIVVSTAEYAHGTIGPTFLVSPIRERVVASKIAAGMLAAAALAALAWAAALGLAALWVAIRSVSSHLLSQDTFTVLLGLMAAAAVAGAIGVGFGALLRRQTAAIVLALVWLLIGEPVIAISGKQRYGPGHVIVAIAEAGHQTNSQELLAFWPALLLGLGYAALLGVAGTLVVTRSDVT